MNTVLKTFVIGTAVGGVMEKPEYTYENIRRVEAACFEEAIEKYYEIFPQNYWFAREIHEQLYKPLELKKEMLTSDQEKELAEASWFSSLKERKA
jgi:hypothetical protein